MTESSSEPARYVDSDHMVETTESLRDSDPEAPPLDGGTDASDHYLAVEDFGTTADEARRGESLDQRLAEEEPDVSPDGTADTDDESAVDGRAAEESALHVIEEG